MSEKPKRINVDRSKARILVVDDEPVNVKLLDKLLTASGYRNVVTTTDPTETLRLYKEYQCDLILLDINMPKMDGYQVMKQFHKEFPDDFPAVLILTAQNIHSFKKQAFDCGARDYVTKPFNAEELLARVDSLLSVELANRYMRSQNEILEQKVRERTQEIHDTRLQVVRRLGLAAEYRDNETGLHIIRMSKFAEVLGNAVGMPEDQCDLLLNAAPMHDIGKIGIPDHILLKPGKLDPEERIIMETHAQIGANILSGDDSELLKMAHDIALTHHEKWNGSGYPNKLKGEDIPITGRITALADVFDALTSARPYKKAWPIEDAIEFIQKQSGEHFEPLLVKLFLENMDEILQIREQYAEPEQENH